MENFETEKLLFRPRSARRLRHEAQVKVFEKEAGDLEKIRNSLGLRPSQICEILKVHPSAWTRWTRTRRAPPHVFQMLEWYIEILRWRGQHNPLPPGALQPRAKEDLGSYVPAHENRMLRPTFDGGYIPVGPESGEASTKLQKSPLMSRGLIVLWATQLVVLGLLFFLLFTAHAPH